jgi:hypothetical protein
MLYNILTIGPIIRQSIDPREHRIIRRQYRVKLGKNGTKVTPDLRRKIVIVGEGLDHEQSVTIFQFVDQMVKTLIGSLPDSVIGTV